MAATKFNCNNFATNFEIAAINFWDFGGGIFVRHYNTLSTDFELSK